MASCRVWILVCACTLLLASGPASAAVDNVVTQWLTLLQDASRAQAIPAHLGARYTGMMALAQLRAIDESGLPPADAAAVAGHAVLSALFPWLQSSTFDGALKRQLGAAKPGAAALAGRKKAQAIAFDIVKQQTGGAAATYSGYEPFPPGTPFRYQAAPNQTFFLYPQLGDAAPLVAKRERLAAVARDPKWRPPRPLGSDYNETFVLGRANSSAHGPKGAATALFWAHNNANTSGISAQWLQIAQKVLPASLSVRDTAKFFAQAGAGAYDASILCYKLKYSVQQWRPIHAFKQGFNGTKLGNATAKRFPATPDWMPQLRTPPHPEYPSGHQCMVGAILEALTRTLGTGKATFSIGSENVPDAPPRTFNSLSEAAEEVGRSRMLGGVHFPSSNADGLALGRLVGGEVFDSVAAASPGKAPAAGAGRRLLHGAARVA